MAKIAVLFLLVALIAVSNGYRVNRDLPEPPSAAPEFLKTLVAETNKYINEGNLNKLMEQAQKIKERTDELGETAGNAIQAYAKSVFEVVKATEEKLTPK